MAKKRIVDFLGLLIIGLALSSNALADKHCFGVGAKKEASFDMVLSPTQILLNRVNNIPELGEELSYIRDSAGSSVRGKFGTIYNRYASNLADSNKIIFIDEALLAESATGIAKISVTKDFLQTDSFFCHNIE